MQGRDFFLPEIGENLDVEVEPEQSQNEQVHRIEQVVQQFGLLSPLAVVGQGETETQQCPRFFYHGEVSEENSRERMVPEQVEEVGHQDAVVIVVQAAEHGQEAHDGDHRNGNEEPQPFLLVADFLADDIHNPDGHQHEGQGEHHVVPAPVHKFLCGEEVERNLGNDAEQQEVPQVVPAAVGAIESFHQHKSKQREGNASQDVEEVAEVQQLSAVQIRVNHALVEMVDEHGNKCDVFQLCVGQLFNPFQDWSLGRGCACRRHVVLSHIFSPYTFLFLCERNSIEKFHVCNSI